MGLELKSYTLECFLGKRSMLHLAFHYLHINLNCLYLRLWIMHIQRDAQKCKASEVGELGRDSEPHALVGE